MPEPETFSSRPGFGAEGRVAGRSVQGLGAGAMTPILFTAIGRGYQEETQLRMFALASTAWVLPGVVGPGLAGLVADQLGWRWVFAGLVPFVTVAGTVTLLALRRVPAAEQPAPAPPTPAVAGFALGAALILGGTGTAWWPLAAALIVVGLALAAVTARTGRLIPVGTVRAAPGSPAVVASRFLLLYGFVAVDAFVPFAVTQIRHRSVLVGSIAVTAGTLTWTAGTWTSERLVKRRWHRGAVLRAGFTVLAAAVVVEITYLIQGVPLAVGFLGSALAGYGTGMAHGLQSALALANAPEGAEGQASSSVSLADTTAFAAGPALTGALVTVADHQGWPLATGVAAGWAVALAAALTGTVVGGRAARLPSGAEPAAAPADT